MDGDPSDSRAKLQQLEPDRNSAPVRRVTAFSGRIDPVRREPNALQHAEALAWPPCPYCGHGYRSDARLQRHLEEHHGPEQRVQVAIRGRTDAAGR